MSFSLSEYTALLQISLGSLQTPSWFQGGPLRGRRRMEGGERRTKGRVRGKVGERGNWEEKGKGKVG